eukprot:m.213394 g.213394  ORF g.213394 m.213394 type:complete len:344 (+) comp25578_c0_seq1:92-1123(+)
MAWHKHNFGDIVYQHKHSDDEQHDEALLTLGTFDKAIYKGNQVLPPEQHGLRNAIFPSWTRPHPWYDVLPVQQAWLSHASRHYNSSGISNKVAGALTLLTQGYKTAALCVLYGFFGSSYEDTVYYAILASTGVMALVLLALWVRLWRHDVPDCLLSCFNWCFYVNAWFLGARTLFAKVFMSELGFLVQLVPPAYVFLRTLLFFTKEQRRAAFLLAAISNRSVPLSVNKYVVGPAETVNSHRFLVLLNLYAFFATIVSKVIIFALDPGLPPLIWAVHIIHLLLTLHCSLFQIRCRQIALDTYVTASEKLAQSTAASTSNLLSSSNLVSMGDLVSTSNLVREESV